MTTIGTASLVSTRSTDNDVLQTLEMHPTTGAFFTIPGGTLNLSILNLQTGSVTNAFPGVNQFQGKTVSIQALALDQAGKYAYVISSSDILAFNLANSTFSGAVFKNLQANAIRGLAILG